MSRILCLVCCICLLTACGDRTPLPVWDGFSCTVTALYDGVSYTARLERVEPSVTTLTFSEPPSVKGLIVSRRGEQVTVSFEGQTYETQASACLSSSLIVVLTEVADVDGRRQTPQNGEVCGTVCGEEYRLEYDQTNGQLRSLKVPSVSLTVLFSDFC